MRRLAFVCLFLSATSVSADALCLFSCIPSEANARAAFEHLAKNEFGAAPYVVASFEKTNGVEREINGQKIYDLSIKAQVQLPNGLNTHCIAQSKNWNYGCLTLKFYPPGQLLNYTLTLTFAKTERGWKGPDGELY